MRTSRVQKVPEPEGNASDVRQSPSDSHKQVQLQTAREGASPTPPEAILASGGEQRHPPLTEEKTRELAYFKWQAAGSPCCDGVAFWLDAENQLADVEQTED